MNKLVLNDITVQRYDHKTSQTLGTKFSKLLVSVSPLSLPLMSFLAHLNYNLPPVLIKYLECQNIYLSLFDYSFKFLYFKFRQRYNISLKSILSALVISMHIMGFEDECWDCEQISKNQTSKEQKSQSRNKWEKIKMF